MSADEAVKSLTFEADASIGFYTGVPGMPGSTSPNGGKEFYWVKVTGYGGSNATVGLCTGAAHEIPIGVLQNKPQAVGDDAGVAVFGRTLCASGGACAVGPVKLDGTSRVVTGVAGTDKIVGIALKAADAVGELIPVLVLAPAIYGVGA